MLVVAPRTRSQYCAGVEPGALITPNPVTATSLGLAALDMPPTMLKRRLGLGRADDGGIRADRGQENPMALDLPLVPDMTANKLSEAELSGVLAKLPNWRLDGGKLCREYQFMNFIAAFSFMTSVALVAQEMGHHPDWSNSWNMVRIALSTHDLGGISSLDAKLAHAMEEMAKRQLNP